MLSLVAYAGPADDSGAFFSECQQIADTTGQGHIQRHVDRQQDNEHDRGPGDDVECPPVDIAAHEVSVVGQESRADEYSAGQSM